MSGWDILQWSAMVVTVVAAYWIASTHKRRRRWGFYTFLASNILWSIWGFHASAYALVTLQVCLAALNIRGFTKNQ